MLPLHYVLRYVRYGFAKTKRKKGVPKTICEALNWPGIPAATREPTHTRGYHTGESVMLILILSTFDSHS